MIFEPIIHDGKTLGYGRQSGDILYFFGTDNSTLENLKSHFNRLHFMNIKQVHGDTLIESTLARADLTPTADAHWTSMLNVAMLVQTADCLPVLISHDRFICAIHAGWRGVKNEVTKKSLSHLCKLFSLSQNDMATIEVVYGPHIQAQSFEVDISLAHDFQNQYVQLGYEHEITLPHKRPDSKSYVDLSKILRAQILSCGLIKPQITEFSADTFTDPRFASFRRQRESATRNFSFVARLA